MDYVDLIKRIHQGVCNIFLLEPPLRPQHGQTRSQLFMSLYLWVTMRIRLVCFLATESNYQMLNTILVSNTKWCNDYSIFLKYSCKSCLHAPFFSVSGFYNLFFMSPFLSLSSHSTNCSFHFMPNFITLSSLPFTLSILPQHYMNLFSTTSSGHEQYISI